MKNLKNRLALTAAAIVIGAPAMAGEKPSPSSAVDTFVKLITAAVRLPPNQRLPGNGQTQGFCEIVTTSAALTEMSKAVLPEGEWDKAGPEQRARFLKEAKSYLAIFSANQLESLTSDLEKVSLGDPTEKNGVTGVPVKMVGQEDAVVFVIPYSDGNYRVFDMIVGKVSLMGNTRAQFKQVVKKSGLDGLLKALEENSKKSKLGDCQ
jgi:ABC-type transporter MlaC component